MKYLCLDLGTAHTGLALSEEGILATPLATIFEKDLDSLVGKLTPYLARTNPDCLVIGTPSHGLLVDYGKLLEQKIKNIYSGQIIFYNEDLSSKKAQSTLDRSKKSHKQKKQQQHQTAAAHILQDYLDGL
ncbi:hypothetical protein A2572_02935 [Candidatus Collierbacteria bacterium RIFOXYD1_FULL_40_9]|uniref:YqgF/RNase H-like domain-containing protein n=1 Tax=Candidatus Collierbacteria bacterium RIFOXYD1_FULL_40_9 TaxID=1817731 RepID=A0A1F5FUV4_9BACT|nr:MAG: hypothetical protein A2572_02935 [Candidatus Collierbacteria bacterium RIFOXYD1_FULL_40_9]